MYFLYWCQVPKQCMRHRWKAIESNNYVFLELINESSSLPQGQPGLIPYHDLSWKIMSIFHFKLHKKWHPESGSSCHGSMIHEVLFLAGIILFPVELLGEMGDPPCVISTRDSLLFRMRFSRLFFVYLLIMAA